ncbi:DCC1 [Candida margitis]|uniref:DCC1 n=1 Tax=Candida margitis TaxID=1775924 RepID=UPI0022272814|nr:DCC1 [Candida margitis]KAI5970727.1 DCC1 [Candida margitis]
MTSIRVYQQLRSDANNNYTYKLIQLPPNLLTHLSTSPSPHLDLKTKRVNNKGTASVTNNNGDDDDNDATVVVCTRDATFKLRQNNHSNCVLLMNQCRIGHHEKHENENGYNDDDDDDDVLMGFAKCNYVYELTTIPGSILDIVPEYGNKVKSSQVTRDQLIASSPCSLAEFEKIYTESCLCEIATDIIDTTSNTGDMYVYKLSHESISQILHTLITYLISENRLNHSFSISELDLATGSAHAHQGVFDNWQPSMIHAVIYKFTTPTPDQGQDLSTVDPLHRPLRLNDESIAHWFGIQELSKLDASFGSSTTTVADFLLNWKTALPSFYNVPLEIIHLRGHYYTTSPTTTSSSSFSTANSLVVKFIDQSSLSRDVATRFKQLLAIQSQWKYDEFIACLAPVIEPGKKIDTTILKYGKKKRVKRDQFIVCGR